MSAVALRSRQQKSHLTAIFSVVVVTAFEGLAVITILPRIATEIGGYDRYGQVAGAYFAACLVGVGLSRPMLQSRYSSKFAGMASIVVAVGLAVSALAPSMAILALGRIIQGIGGGYHSSYAYYAAGEFFPEESRPRIFAGLSTSWLIAGLLAPTAANLLSDHFGWRSVFWTPAIVVIGTAIQFVRFPQPNDTSISNDTGESAPSSNRWLSLLLGGGTATVALLLSLWVGPTGAARSLLLVLSLTALVAIFVPLIDRDTLRLKSLASVLIVVNLILGFSYFSVESLIPLVIEVMRTEGVFVAGLVISSGSLLWTVGSWAQAAFARKLPMMAIMAVGTVLIVAGLVTVVTALRLSGPIWVVTICWWTATAGMGLTSSYIAYVVVSSAELQTSTSSILLQASNLAASYTGATFVAGTIANRLIEFDTNTALAPLQISLAIVCPAVLAILFSRARRQSTRARK